MHILERCTAYALFQFCPNIRFATHSEVKKKEKTHTLSKRQSCLHPPGNQGPSVSQHIRNHPTSTLPINNNTHYRYQLQGN